MLEYYFCEECQEYHYPNRIINGEILAACEREIATDTGDELKIKKLQTGFIKGWSARGSQPHSPRLNFQYSNTATHNIPNNVSKMPFLDIISEENKAALRRIRQDTRKSSHTPTQLVRARSQDSLPSLKQRIKIPPPSRIQIMKYHGPNSTTSIQSPIQSIENLAEPPSKIPLSKSTQIRLSQPELLEEEDQKDCCYKCCYF